LRQNIKPTPRAAAAARCRSGSAGGRRIFFIVDALFTRQKGLRRQISFPKEGIGSAAECIGLVKGNKNGAAAKN